MSTRMDRLRELQGFGGRRRTVGLEDEVVERFLDRDPSLGLAIDEAYSAHLSLRSEWGDLLREDEADLIDELQDDLLNFYAADTINPYVPLSARGPWLITSHGAVIARQRRLRHDWVRARPGPRPAGDGPTVRDGERA